MLVFLVDFTMFAGENIGMVTIGGTIFYTLSTFVSIFCYYIFVSFVIFYTLKFYYVFCFIFIAFLLKIFDS